MVVIAVMFPVANTISSLVKEKELRIKEGLKMMGLTGLAHTASWVVHFACLFFFISLLMVLASGTLFQNRQDLFRLLYILPASILCTLSVPLLSVLLTWYRFDSYFCCGSSCRCRVVQWQRLDPIKLMPMLMSVLMPMPV